MITVIIISHIIVSIGLILVVLLQTGKGAEVGAVFGGSSATIFGSSGAGNFLTRLTTGMAIVFMITSLTLGYFTAKRPSATIFDSRAPSVEPRAPMQPPPAAQTQSAPSAGAQKTPTAPDKTPSEKSTTP
jgi:preprotein translocase subunit SecG